MLITGWSGAPLGGTRSLTTPALTPSSASLQVRRKLIDVNLPGGTRSRGTAGADEEASFIGPGVAKAGTRRALLAVDIALSARGFTPSADPGRTRCDVEVACRRVDIAQRSHSLVCWSTGQATRARAKWDEDVVGVLDAADAGAVGEEVADEPRPAARVIAEEQRPRPLRK